MSDELESRRDDAVLRDNTFGILDSDGTTQEKIGRLLALLPMAFDVMDEARDTIARLRDENERLRQAQVDAAMIGVAASGATERCDAGQATARVHTALPAASARSESPNANAARPRAAGRDAARTDAGGSDTASTR